MNSIRSGLIGVCCMLLVSACTKQSYFQIRDGFKPDIEVYYPQTETSQSLPILDCYQEKEYTASFDICPISKDGIQSDAICFKDCECEGLPSGQLVFKLLELSPGNLCSEEEPMYILSVAFGMFQNYPEFVNGNVRNIKDTGWEYYSLFAGKRDPLNSAGNMISVTVNNVERVIGICGNPPTPQYRKEKVEVIFRYEKEGEEWVLRSVKKFGHHFLSGGKSLVFDLSDMFGEDVIRLAPLENPNG